MDLLKKLKSRTKLQTTLAGCLIALATALQGKISWELAIGAIIAQIAVYVWSEAGIDRERAKSAILEG